MECKLKILIMMSRPSSNPILCRIWNHKTYPKNPILVKDDKPIKEFRRWYSQFYTANSRRESMGANAVEYENENGHDKEDRSGKGGQALISTKKQDVVFGCKAHAGLDW